MSYLFFQFIFLPTSNLLADWTVPLEVGADSEGTSIDFINWFSKAATVIICTLLIYKTASSLKDENYAAAFLSFLGAIIVAIAPEVLKSMFFST